MEDFTQDQKIDALIQEAQRDNEAEAAVQTDDETLPAAPVDPVVEDETDGPAEGGSAIDPSADEPTDDQGGEVDPAEILIGLDQPVDPAEILIGLDQPVDPAEILIGLDEPAEGGLKDDFDTMIAEPGSRSEFDTSDIDVPAGRSLDVNVDEDGPVEVQEITDVRATYIPPAEQPVLITDSPADLPFNAPVEATIDSPIHLADDVLGDASVASLVGQAEPAVVDLGEPIQVDVGASQIVTELIETEQVVDLVEVVVEPIVQIEPIPAPVDDLVDEEVDFAADLAGDITPAAPDTTLVRAVITERGPARSDEAEARDHVDEGVHVGLHRLVSWARSDDLEEVDELAAFGDRGEEHRLHLRQRSTLRVVEIDPSQVHDVVPESSDPFTVILGARSGLLQLHPRGLGGTFEIDRAGDRIVTNDRVHPKTVVVGHGLPDDAQHPRRLVDYPAVGYCEDEWGDAGDHRARMHSDARCRRVRGLFIRHSLTLVHGDNTSDWFSSAPRASVDEPGRLPVTVSSEFSTITDTCRVRPMRQREVAAA